MFFEDRAAGLREMMRVLKPGGRLAVAVCDSLDQSPGYAAVADMLERLFGNDVANAFRAPFVLGNAESAAWLCAEAGIRNAEVKRHKRNGPFRLDRIADFDGKSMRLDAWVGCWTTSSSSACGKRPSRCLRRS